MFPNQRFTTLSILAVFILLFTSFRPAERNIEQVRALLIGEWKVVDMVVEPGKPFPGTQEEEQLLKQLTKNVLDNSASTVFIFHADNQFEVKLPNATQSNKNKVTWEVIQDGDILLVKSKKANDTVLKILVIEEGYLELFSDTNKERILYVFEKN
jgi:hypothetical protein